MSNSAVEDSTKAVLDTIRGTRDALTVRRVFGDAYELDGVTIIPVARLAGGSGGGGGGGITEGESGSGFGTGFGLGVRPIGVYEVRDTYVAWRPTIDTTALARGGQMLAGLAIVCATAILLRRGRA